MFLSVTDIVCELFRYTVPKFRGDGERLSPATVRVKFCGVVVTALVAEKTIGNVPATLGVPESVPVPLWLSTNVTLAGSAPASAMLGVGNPVVVTVKEFGTPYAKVALLALVKAGACWRIIVNDCVTGEPIPFVAVKLMLKSPPINTSGVPWSVPVPLPLSTKLRPVGRWPASVMLGVGIPDVVTVNDPKTPIVKMVLFALVKAGGTFATTV
jgi:hypothetical protein